MEARIKTLGEVIAEGEKEGKGEDLADAEDPVFKARKEIKELNEIIPEIKSKIEDILEEQKTAEVTKAEVKAAVGGIAKALSSVGEESSTLGAGEGSSSEPAQVITHLVRKKRKNEDEVEEDTKKAKLENGTNGSGDAPANGSNGSEANGKENSASEKKEETPMETGEEIKTKTVEDVQAAAETAATS
eukprot:GHVN01016532.1.p1 GENE.GHVN01016532.1~~GHVN01016532.1.p1  ORF type:complete len:188 (-),score=53.03 GHVN01016532.1:69-632(-)